MSKKAPSLHYERCSPMLTLTLVARRLSHSLYELICVSAISPSTAPFRELVRSTTRLVVDNGGAVRGMQYWGRRFLPQRAKRHQQYHYQGE